jgi:hypothetical protein
MTRPHLNGPEYLVRLRAVGPNPIHGLRHLLKYALRQCAFRCVSVVEVKPKKGLSDDDPETKADLA